MISPVVAGTRCDPEMLRSLDRPDLTISRVKISHGPASIESAFDDMLAVPDTVAKIIEAERDGVHAAVIDCMGDPGLHAAREAVAIPVLVPAGMAMHVAAMLGHRFSIVTVLDRFRPLLENQAKISGVGAKLASVRAVELPVLELESRAAQAVAKNGADAIIFGCTGMFGWAKTVREGLLAAGLTCRSSIPCRRRSKSRPGWSRSVSVTARPPIPRHRPRPSPVTNLSPGPNGSTRPNR